jgi:hypothetical protein
MRIRVWNAYASNNSGSYTIVGRFGTPAEATSVAAELLALVKAQSAWAAQTKDQHGPSPLEDFARQNGFSTTDGMADEWPQYSQQPHPDVWTVERQLFLYSDYQVSMPRTFGELIYARGGRVEYEVNHAHHPMAALFEIYWPWKGRTEEKVAAGVQQILRALNDDLRFSDNQAEDALFHAWRASTDWMMPNLRIGAVFANIVDGFAAVDAAVRAAGASMNVRLHEAFNAGGDEFPILRPSEPALAP